MALVKHLIKANSLTGEIVNIVLGPAELPPEGLEESTGEIIVYCFEDLPDPAEFLEMNYVDTETYELVQRPPKPGAFSFWENDQWNLNEEWLLQYVRNERGLKLTVTDWTQLPDSPLTEEQKLEAVTYRQALRDITVSIQQNPQNYNAEELIPWPTPPSFLNIEI